MHVIATAGHVDHGKSTLVRALTGTDPDRWAEEKRRGLTIDLGFAWADIGGRTIAFVDVPGHERFVPNMLAGVGPLPAALLVVAADEGWMPQTAEHTAALDALGVRHAVAAISRSDRADPGPVAADVADRLRSTSMGVVACVPVSSPTGSGLAELRGELAHMASALPAPDREAPVRLWVDRAFSVRGAGTVVTGTLAVGTLHVGDRLELNGRAVGVRALESMDQRADEVAAVARVAVNLRDVDAADVRRGDALLTPGVWAPTDTLDVRLGHADPLPTELTLHIGSAAVPARVRRLAGDMVRLVLRSTLPLAAGDIGLLRDPGLHRVVSRVDVLDPAPPSLRRRGAAAARAGSLRELHRGGTDGTAELRRRGVTTVTELARLGVTPPVVPTVGDWLVDPDHADVLRRRAHEVVGAYARSQPLEPGPPVDGVRRALGLPDRALVGPLLRPPLELRAGRVVDTGREQLPPAVAAAVATLAGELADTPFAAPVAGRLRDLGLGARELAAAERAGALLRVAHGVVLMAGAEQAAVTSLHALSQPFTVSEARRALGTTRRVAVPLLELLDRRGLTRRGADDRRVVAVAGGG